MNHKRIIASVFVLLTAFWVSSLAPLRVHADTAVLNIPQSSSSNNIFGAGEGGVPTATTIRGAAAVGTNIPGANFTFDASKGTGTGGSGALIFRTAPAGSTGTTSNTLTEIMRITPAGNVGIGTTGPSTKLHLSGARNESFITLQSTESVANTISVGVQFGNTIAGSFTQLGKFQYLDGNMDFTNMVNGTGADIRFSTQGEPTVAGNTKLIIKNGGNVGIGTTSPVGKLHLSTSNDWIFTIEGSKGKTFQAYKDIDAGGAYRYALNLSTGDTTGVMDFFTATGNSGSESWVKRISMYTTSGHVVLQPTSGNVGIGTTAPGSKLEVSAGTINGAVALFTGAYSGTASGDGPSFGVANSNATTNNKANIAFYDGGTAASAWLETTFVDRTNHYGDFGFITKAADGYVDRLHIKSNGNVGIGTTSPLATLDVAGSASMSGTLTVGNGGTIRPQYGPLTLAYKSDLNSWTTGITLQDTTGSVGIGTTTPASSDKVTIVQSSTAANTTGLWVTGTGANTTGTSYGTYVSKDAGAGGTAVAGYFQAQGGTNNYGLIVGAGNVGIGTTAPTSALTVIGGITVPSGVVDITRSSNPPLQLDRTTDDGILVKLQQAGTTEGNISVSGTTVSYNAFTGSHLAWTDEHIERGMLVSLTGNNKNSHNNPNAETIYGITKSTTANDPRVLGAYLSPPFVDTEDDQFKMEVDKQTHLVMAVGNGDMWVVDTGRDIQIGDYLISSDTPGHAMLDTGSFPISYIVARVGENVEWSRITQTINGKKHKKISVFFESFTRDTTIGVCKDLADGSADVKFKECSGTPGDIAEFYQAEADLVPGDVVALNQTTATTQLVKTKRPYDSAVFGVVSTYPVGQFGKPLGTDTLSPDAHPTAIALTGKVPVKVTAEHGAILPGDPLTASPIPGVAMKATKPGKIIGFALEAYNGTIKVSQGTRQQEAFRREAVVKYNADPIDPVEPGVGKILVQANNSWWDPDVYLTSTQGLRLSKSETNSNDQNPKFNILHAAGETIDRIGAFAELAVANLTSGIIETKQLLINGVDTEKKLLELEAIILRQQEVIDRLERAAESPKP